MTVHKPFSYKTHLLIGQFANAHATVVARWDHVPTQKEIEAEIAKVSSNHTAFVLVNVVGDEYKGTYVPPVDYGCY